MAFQIKAQSIENDDTGYPADIRASERNRRIQLTIGTSLLSKTIVVIAPLVTTPITLHYLGAERYGLWMTVTSIVSMFAFADLGLGNGLLTKIGNSYGNDDDVEARRYISSGYFLVSFFAVTIFLVTAALSAVTPWEKLLNASSPAIRAEASWVAIICLAAFLFNLPLGLIQRVQLGIQQGFQSNLWQCLSSLLSMGLIFLAVESRLGIAALVACAVAVAPLVSWINGAVFFRYQKPQLKPKLRHFEWQFAKELLNLGLLFFALSILTVCTFYADNLIVAHVFGLNAVASYSIPAKLAGLLATIVSVLCLPLWPANAEALTRGDLSWVERSTRRMFFLSVGTVGVAAVVLVAIGPAFIYWWLGDDFGISRMLLASLGLWTLLLAGTGPYFMVLNSAGMVRFQVYAWLIFLPLSIILKVLLAKQMGLPGIPLAGAMGYAVVIIPSVAVAYRRLIRQKS